MVSMRSIGLWPLALALVVTATPRPSRACSVCDMHGVIEVPNLDPLPGNSGWMVWGVDDPFPECEAFVDGVPATLELIPDVGPIETIFSGSSMSATVVRVTPPPSVGAIVEVVDSEPVAWCFGQRDPTAVQSFVAGPVDVDAPADIEGLYWDVHGFETTSTTSCELYFMGAIYIQGQLAAEDPLQAPRLVDVEVALAGDTLFRRRWRVTDAPFQLVLPRSDFLGLDPESLCVRTTMVDLAGNIGTTSEWMCAPCHAVYESETIPDTFPDQPLWSDADLVPGGYCNDGTPPPGPSDDGTDDGPLDGGTDTGPPPSTSTSTTGEPTDPASDDASDGATTDPGEIDPDGTVPRGCECRLDARPRWSDAWLLLPMIALRRRRSRPAKSW